jgi:hypothetical protein
MDCSTRAPRTERQVELNESAYTLRSQTTHRYGRRAADWRSTSGQGEGLSVPVPARHGCGGACVPTSWLQESGHRGG